MVLGIRAALHFSSQLSLREFEVEMWKLYFGVQLVKPHSSELSSTLPDKPRIR